MAQVTWAVIPRSPSELCERDGRQSVISAGRFFRQRLWASTHEHLLGRKKLQQFHYDIVLRGRVFTRSFDGRRLGPWPSWFEKPREKRAPHHEVVRVTCEQ